MDSSAFNCGDGSFSVRGSCLGCAVFLLAAMVGLGVGIGFLIWGK